MWSLLPLYDQVCCFWRPALKREYAHSHTNPYPLSIAHNRRYVVDTHTGAYSIHPLEQNWPGSPKPPENNSLFIGSFSQRRECGRGFSGSSKEDLPEYPRWQSGPECCRVWSPAQTVCAAGRSPQRRQSASQRRLQLLTTDRKYRPIRHMGGQRQTDEYTSPPGTNTCLLSECVQQDWDGLYVTSTMSPNRDWNILHPIKPLPAVLKSDHIWIRLKFPSNP